MEKESKSKSKIMKVLLIAFAIVIGVLAISSAISNIVTNSKQKKVLKQNSLEYISGQLTSTDTLQDHSEIQKESYEELFCAKYDNELSDEQISELRERLLKVNEASDNIYIKTIGEYQYNLARVWDFELSDYVDGYVNAAVELLGKEEFENTTFKFYDSDGSTIEIYKHTDEKLYANVMTTFMSKESFNTQYYSLGINVINPAKTVELKEKEVWSTLEADQTLYYDVINQAKLHDVTVTTNSSDAAEYHVVFDNTDKQEYENGDIEEFTWITFTLGPREIEIVKHIKDNVDSYATDLEFLRFLFDRDITSPDIVGNVEIALNIYGANLH